jgi:hypothetical protein
MNLTASISRPLYPPADIRACAPKGKALSFLQSGSWALRGVADPSTDDRPESVAVRAGGPPARSDWSWVISPARSIPATPRSRESAPRGLDARASGNHVRGDLWVVGENGRAIALPSGREVITDGRSGRLFIRSRQMRTYRRSNSRRTPSIKNSGQWDDVHEDDHVGHSERVLADTGR